MMERASIQAARFVILAAIIALSSACVTRGPFIPGNLAPGARSRVELDATPFFPQDKYQCGPAALATVLAASGVDVTPAALIPRVYLPARHGSLQVEMEAAPRDYGRLIYPLSPNMDSILAELDAGRPVLVLHNYGLSILPRWHYAVVIGYDATRDRFILRSGDQRRREWRARTFMLAWHNGGRWAMVALAPGEMPASANPAQYLEAAALFERGADAEASRLAFESAVRRWPSEAIAWIGRGTAQYRAGNYADAARDYETALRIDPAQVAARNNLAQVLLDLGCPSRAREELRSIDATALKSPLRESVLDTQRNADAAAGVDDDPDRCRPSPSG
jgi:tetratricopeptide (TPR) repeat protein